MKCQEVLMQCTQAALLSAFQAAVEVTFSRGDVCDLLQDWHLSWRQKYKWLVLLK